MFRRFIVLWFEPFIFDLSPKHLDWIEVWAVSWQIPDKQTLLLPLTAFVSNGVCGMPPGIVQNQNGRAFDCLNKIVEAFDDKLCIDGFCGWIRAKLLV